MLVTFVLFFLLYWFSAGLSIWLSSERGQGSANTSTKQARRNEEGQRMDRREFSCSEQEHSLQLCSYLTAYDMVPGDSKAGFPYMCLDIQSSLQQKVTHRKMLLANVVAKLVCSALKDFRYWLTQWLCCLTESYNLSNLCSIHVSPVWKCLFLAELYHLAKQRRWRGIDTGMFICHQTAVTHLSALYNIKYFILFKCL